MLATIEDLTCGRILDSLPLESTLKTSLLLQQRKEQEHLKLTNQKGKILKINKHDKQIY